MYDCVIMHIFITQNFVCSTRRRSDMHVLMKDNYANSHPEGQRSHVCITTRMKCL